MTLNFSLTVLLLLITPAMVTGQVADIKSATAKKSVVEFERQKDSLEAEYLKALQNVDREFKKKFETAKDRLVAELEDSLAKAAKKVDLAEANKINSTIGSFADTQFASLLPKETANTKKAINQLPAKYHGKWVGSWGTTGNEILFNLNKKGDSEFGRMQFRDGRMLLLEKRAPQYHELIPYNEGLLVLGFTIRHNRHPLKTLPNHVGFVSKQK